MTGLNETKVYTTIIIGFTIFAIMVMSYYALGIGHASEVGVMLLQFAIFTVKLFFCTLYLSGSDGLCRVLGMIRHKSLDGIFYFLCRW
jgi:hypothetical protein